MADFDYTVQGNVLKITFPVPKRCTRGDIVFHAGARLLIAGWVGRKHSLMLARRSQSLAYSLQRTVGVGNRRCCEDARCTSSTLRRQCVLLRMGAFVIAARAPLVSPPLTTAIGAAKSLTDTSAWWRGRHSSPTTTGDPPRTAIAPPLTACPRPLQVGAALRKVRGGAATGF